MGDFSRARGENPLEFIRIDGYPGSVFPSKQTKQAKAGMMNGGKGRYTLDTLDQTGSHLRPHTVLDLHITAQAFFSSVL